jgi:hypothetical protein
MHAIAPFAISHPITMFNLTFNHASAREIMNTADMLFFKIPKRRNFNCSP